MTASEEPRADFSLILRDNESAVVAALEGADYVQAFLLLHTLVEALLRIFLRKEGDRLSFDDLIQDYRQFLEEEKYPYPEFIKELTEFNRRRNRIIHELWRKDYTFTNVMAEPAARGAQFMYRLFIEWLETFDPEITKIGFRYEGEQPGRSVTD